MEYIVCDVNLLDADSKPHVYGKESQKVRETNEKNKSLREICCFQHALGEVFVIKSSEVGVVDKQYSTISHLGGLLHPGDTVMGFDLQNSNVSDPSLDSYDLSQLADVVRC